MNLRLVTAPAKEPVTIDELTAEARVSTDDEKARLERYLATARRTIESWTNRALIQQTWELRLPAFPAVITIPKPPLSSITSLTYKDTAGVTQTLVAASYLLTQPTDDTAEPATLRPAYGTTWPSTRDEPEAVILRYVAGYGDGPEHVPAALRLGIALRAAQLYDGQPDDQRIWDVIAPYRVWCFG